MERRVLGCLLPLSGAYQSIGQRALRGIELAVSVHNSAAGVPPVQVIVKDTASDAGQTCRRCRNWNVKTFWASSGRWSMRKQSTGSTADGHADHRRHPERRSGGVGDYVFRNFITPLAQMRSLVSYAVGHLGSPTPSSFIRMKTTAARSWGFSR